MTGRGESAIVWAIAEGVGRPAPGRRRRRAVPSAPPDQPDGPPAPALRAGTRTRGRVPNCGPRHGGSACTARLELMRRAKIVCTLGPATDSSADPRARSTPGWTSPASTSATATTPSTRRSTSASARRPTRPAAASASSPTSRARRSASARFANGPYSERGDDFTITIEDVPGDENEVAHHLRGPRPATSRAGDRILVDDGKLALEVDRVDGARVVTPGHRGRHVSEQQGPQPARRRRVASPRSPTRTRTTCAGRCASASTSSRSRSSAAPTTSSDVRADHGRGGPIRLPVIAKIEKPQAVENLDEIVDAFDGIMVARGDLGVEMPLEQVPIVQKRAIELARATPSRSSSPPRCSSR